MIPGLSEQRILWPGQLNEEDLVVDMIVVFMHHSQVIKIAKILSIEDNKCLVLSLYGTKDCEFLTDYGMVPYSSEGNEGLWNPNNWIRLPTAEEENEFMSNIL